MNWMKIRYQALTPGSRTAFWLLLTVAIALGGFSGLTIPRLFYFREFLPLVVNTMPTLLTVVALVSAGMLLTGRNILGGYVFLVGFSTIMFFVPIVISDMGFLVATLEFIIVSYVSNLVMPRRISQNVPFIAGMVAVAILLLDVYWPFPRDFISPADLRIATIVTLIIVAVYGYFLVREFSNFRLRNKLILVSLVLAIAPMAMIGFMTSRVSQNSLTDNANRSLLISASQISNILDSFFINNMDTVRTSAQLGDVVELLELPADQRSGSTELEHVHAILGTLLQKSPIMITSIGVIDNRGIIVADTDETELGTDKSGREYFTEAVRTGLPQVQVLFSEVSRRPSLYFSAPVRNAQGEVIGAMRIRYNADVIQQQIIRQASLPGRETGAMLISNENILLAHSSNPQIVYRSIVPLDAVQLTEMKETQRMPLMMALQESFIDMPLLAEGIRNAGTVQTFAGEFHPAELYTEQHIERAGVVELATLPWYVVVFQSEEQLLAPVTTLARGALVLGIIASVVAIVFSILVAQFLTNPISTLDRASRDLASGNLAVRVSVNTRDEVGNLANTFNYVVEQLANMVNSLEQRVADRTKALATSTEVSRRLSTILDQKILVREVVQQLQAAFQYYHVHVYLFDEKRENLVLVEGTGEASQVMLNRGHHIPAGRGLVGRAADTGSAVIVADVQNEPGWLPNPLLPETKSELAVPIAIGDTVLGVLDVQQNVVGGLQQEDADLLQSISNQVAVALQNARSYAQTQQRANREALLAAIGQRIQHTTSAEEALQVAVRELGRALQSDDVYIQVGASKPNGHQ